jgi:hypothetical protein
VAGEEEVLCAVDRRHAVFDGEQMVPALGIGHHGVKTILGYAAPEATVVGELVGI